jgi:two-component system heavy metal sensor histidine kinase CusS
MRSLRARLLVGTALATIVIFATAGVVLYVSVRSTLLKQFDEELATKAIAMEAWVEQDADAIRMDREAEPSLPYTRKDRPEYFQVNSSDGSAIIHSPSLGTARLSTSTGPVILPDGRAGRQFTRHFVPRWDDEHNGTKPASLRDAVSIVACDTIDLDRTLARLRWLVMSLFAGAALASGLVMAIVVRQGLQPAAALANRIASLNENDLASRIELRDVPAELLPIVQRLNEMLERLAAAMSREKAFTADVAHELRTPLAGLQTTLEVCASRLREPAAYQQTVVRCLETSRRMHAMVDQLLLLARADARQLRVTTEPIDPGVFLGDCWSNFHDRASARGLQVQWDIDHGTTILADAAKLRLVVNNLFDNAVSHADQGGWIQIKTQRSANDNVTLQIANSGSRLSADQAQRAFDRFWRGDTARADTGVHCGLGLSLCRKLMDVLGGTIHLQSQLGGAFVVLLTFPKSPPEWHVKPAPTLPPVKRSA